MASNSSQKEQELVDSAASRDIRALCTSICQSLRATKKKGAQNLLQEVERLNTAVAQTGGQQEATLSELRTVEETVGYWTAKGTGARLHRALDRPGKLTLEECSEHIRALIEKIHNANENCESRPEPSPTPPRPGIESVELDLEQQPIHPPEEASSEPHTFPLMPPHPSRPPSTPSPAPPLAIQVPQPPLPNSTNPETKTKDVILGGFKLFLKSASGVADVIPDPVGKIVKVIAETGVRVMEVLDNIDDNKNEARRLGGHIRGLVQAIVQYLPHKQGMPKAGLRDGKLTMLLEGFLSTLEIILRGLQALQEQGRFSQLALHEQNKSDLEKFGSELDRAYRDLELCLALRTLQSIHGLESANAADRRQSLLDRLKGADNGAGDKADASGGRPVCLPNTRTKVLARIQSWIRTSSKRMFWLNGVAGCGKTAVAATIALHQEELHGTAAIFYCTAGNQARCARVVCSLAHWIARSSHNSLEGAILEAISSEPDIVHLPLAEQVQLLLSIPLQGLAPDAPPVVLIIDALDEWYDTKKASALVALLIKTTALVNVKILVTSRDEKHIKHAFLGAPQGAIDILELDTVDSLSVDGDIEIFLRTHFDELHERHQLDVGWPGPLRLKALVAKCEGLFQFAATVLRYIQLGYPPVALNQVLDGPNTSRTLHSLYLTILQRLFQDAPDVSDVSVLKHVLVGLVCSAAPVSLNVIAYLWDDSDYPMDITTKLNYIRLSVLEHLGSFLVVPTSPNEPLRLLHTSFVEFLLDPSRLQDDPRFFVDIIQGHTYLARRCLERLNRDLRQNICGLEDFWYGADGTDGSWRAKPNDAFSEVIAAAICPGLEYASLYWIRHLDAVPTSPTPVALLPLIYTFTSKHILHWIETLAFLHSVLSVGHPTARKAADWCSRVSTTGLPAPTSLFHDVARFIGLFADIVSSHPLTLYEYVLSFAPTESTLREVYGTFLKTRTEVILGPVQKRWPALKWTAKHGSRINCIAISSDGSMIASGGEDCRIKLWDAASGMPKGEPLEGHTDAVESLVFSRDMRLLVSGSRDKTIWIWDADTGQAKGVALTGHASEVRSLALSPDGAVLVSGSVDRSVRFWGLEDGREIGEPLKMESMVNSVTFTPAGSMIVCGCADGTVRWWDVKERKAVGEAMMGRTERLWSVCVSPDGKVIVSGSEDKNVRLWDMETGQEIGVQLEGHAYAVYSVAFSPNGESIVSGSADDTIRLWDARTGKQRGKALTGHTESVYAAAFTPDGKTVISSSKDGTVRAWGVDGMEDEGEEEGGPSKYVYSVAVTSDARFVATGSRDGWMMVWSMETGSLRGKVKGGYRWGRLLFSADGKALREYEALYGDRDGVVREWDVSGAVEGTGAEIRQVEPDKTLEFPDPWVEQLMIDHEGWIKRGGKKWFWVPPMYGWYARCHLLRTKLVLGTRPVTILDVAALL